MDPTPQGSSIPEDMLDLEVEENPSSSVVEDQSDDDLSPEQSLAEDYTLQGSPHATATNAALRAMSRTARSFLIYDSHNEAIRQFLGEYERTMRAALEHGPVSLGVRPFDLVLEGPIEQEVVYVQRDRSKSLAFRMYRDGVRRIIINPAAEWSELLRLLEILSIRYTGVRQYEDDIVTLLWKAGFQNIDCLLYTSPSPRD